MFVGVYRTWLSFEIELFGLLLNLDGVSCWTAPCWMGYPVVGLYKSFLFLLFYYFLQGILLINVTFSSVRFF